MSTELKVPNFASEKEEAAWGYDHRDDVTDAFERAALTTPICLDPEDIARARSLAAKRGLRYQAYLQVLVHEALASEEKSLEL